MSDTEVCGNKSLLLSQIGDDAWLVSYYISMPIYYLIGILGNITLIMAFFRSAKEEKAYAYQVFLTSGKILQIFCTSSFIVAYKWTSGVEAPGKEWFMRNYYLMFLATYIAPCLFDSSLIISLYLSVSMTADRVFALGKPFLYKTINHTKHQSVAVFVCFFIGIMSNVFLKRWKLVSEGSDSNLIYKGEFDTSYLATRTAIIMGHFRTAVRFFGFACLIVLTVIMCVLFRKQTNKVAQMKGQDEKERKSRSAQISLIRLSISQACLVAVSQIPHSIHWIIGFVLPNYNLCYGPIVAPLVDMCIQIGDGLDLFVLIAISKRVREAVIDMLPCRSGTTVNTPTLAGPNPMH